MTLNKKGFTLIELLVVVAMIAIILGAMTVSVRAAQERARIQKATSEVKILSQAILALENYARGGKYELKPMGGTSPDGGVEADASTLKEILGQGGGDDTGEKIPVLIQAALHSGGKMLDPWGHPYRIQIKPGSANVVIQSATGSLCTSYTLPNFYRLSPEERQ